MAFTEQQVDQDFLPGQSVAPGETHNGSYDPGDAVTCEGQQVHHGAAAPPGGGRVGAHPHALGQADVNGQQGVHGYPLEGRVELHAVLLWHPAGLPPVFAPIIRGVFSWLAVLVFD